MYYTIRFVTGDGLRQESIRRRSDTGKTCEFQLQKDPRVLSPRRFPRQRMGAEVTPCNEPYFPAAGCVLKASEAVERLLVEQGVNDAAIEVPFSANRPCPGGFELF